MSIDRIEKTVKFAQHWLDHYRKQRSTLRTSTTPMTYVHVRCLCRNCGNECIDRASISGAGNVRFYETSPPGYCYDCRDVLADYGYYDDWEEEEDETYICEFCGAEYGDDWSMCSCYDDDVDFNEYGVG